MKISINKFSGMAPKITPSLLPVNMAQDATNCNLLSGALRAWRDMLDLVTPTKDGPLRSIYRNNSGFFLSWNEDVDVTRGPVAGDTLERLYFTSSNDVPRITDADMVVSGSGTDYPNDSFVLGVPAPSVAPTASLSAVVASITRSVSVATVTLINHGFAVGDVVTISGANESAYNGDVTVLSVIDENQFRYTVSGSPATPASGTITAVSTASGTVRAIAYAYTFVTGFTEESAPSPLSEILDATPGQVVRLNHIGHQATMVASSGTAVFSSSSHGLQTGDKILVAGEFQSAYNGVFVITRLGANQFSTQITEPATPQTSSITWFNVDASTTAGKYNVTQIFLYRANTSDSGAQLQFLASIPTGSITYTDSTDDADLAEVIPSTNWDMPPPDMQGIISLPNGVLVGFSKNQVCFSFPYQPHAWPIEYRQTVDYPVVAIGAFGTTVVVATRAHPYMMSGSDPASVSSVKIPHPWACVSKRGLKSCELGVFYPSNEGLIVVGPNGSAVFTKPMMEPEEWALFVPNTINAAIHEGRYFGFYQTDVSNNDVAIGAGFIIDYAESTPSISQLDIFPTAVWSDPVRGKLYFAFDELT